MTQKRALFIESLSTLEGMVAIFKREFPDVKIHAMTWREFEDNLEGTIEQEAPDVVFLAATYGTWKHPIYTYGTKIIPLIRKYSPHAYIVYTMIAPDPTREDAALAAGADACCEKGEISRYFKQIRQKVENEQ